MVKHIKDAIKKSMKGGTNLSATSGSRSPSFTRNLPEDRLNSSDPGPLLRVNNEASGMFRRSFSDDPRRAIEKKNFARNSGIQSQGEQNRSITPRGGKSSFHDNIKNRNKRMKEKEESEKESGTVSKSSVRRLCFSFIVTFSIQRRS